MLNVRCSLLLLSALLIGCRNGTVPPVPSPAPAQPPSMGENSPKKMMQNGQAAMTSTVASAAQMPGGGLRVDLYQLQVPEGTVSRNEKFWKRVDEHSLDPGTYDLLYKNGIRVGQAPIAEWDYFRQVIEQYPAVTKQTSLLVAENKPIELPMRRDIPAQEIFFYNAADALEGRSYDACENIIALTTQLAPRQASVMRIAMCPVVRSVHKRLELTPLNNEAEVTYTAPERMYDVNLRTDVPPDNFLIVAPSAQASRQTSIGNNFLITQGAAERLENVLLLVPKAMRVEEVPAAPLPRKK